MLASDKARIVRRGAANATQTSFTSKIVLHKLTSSIIKFILCSAEKQFISNGKNFMKPLSQKEGVLEEFGSVQLELRNVP